VGGHSIFYFHVEKEISWFLPNQVTRKGSSGFVVGFAMRTDHRGRWELWLCLRNLYVQFLILYFPLFVVLYALFLLNKIFNWSWPSLSLHGCYMTGYDVTILDAHVG
jgi:hypothetical protein